MNNVFYVIPIIIWILIKNVKKLLILLKIVNFINIIIYVINVKQIMY